MSCEALESVRRRLTELGHPDVTVIAVSKTHGPERIRELLECGQRHFGENRQNEARDKFPLVRTSDLAAQARPIYHHIGPLQSGSARQVAGLFDWVHGVGSASALEALAAAAARRMKPAAGRSRAADAGAPPATAAPLQFLIQVRLTQEHSKVGGLPPEDLPELLSRLPASEVATLRGFMTMGPADASPAENRAVFVALRKLRDRYLPGGELSMGMSGDWEIAVAEGATMIRLGTTLFGPRGAAPWKAR